MATAYPRTTFVLGGKVTNTRKGAIDLSELEKVAANLMYYASGPAFFHNYGLAVPPFVKRMSRLAINKRRKSWTPILKDIKRASLRDAPLGKQKNRRGPSAKYPWRRARKGLKLAGAYTHKIGKTGLWGRVQGGKTIGRPPTGDDTLYRTAHYIWTVFYQGGKTAHYNYQNEKEWIRKRADERKNKVIRKLALGEVELIDKMIRKGPNTPCLLYTSPSPRD